MITYSVDNRVTYEFESWNFPAGEVGVRIFDDVLAHERSLVKISASLQNSDDIMELLMLTDAIKRKFTSAKIELKLGYTPYGRQDRVSCDGESLSIKVFANLINSQGYSKVTLIDPHSSVTPAVFDNPEVIQQHQALHPILTSIRDRDILIAPDLGAMNKCQIIKDAYFYKELLVANKVRDPKTGQILSYSLNGEVQGKACVVVDDIIDGGGTFILLGKSLKEMGAKTVTLIATHGIFSKGTKVVTKWYDSVYVTNSYHSNREGLIDGVNYIKI